MISVLRMVAIRSTDNRAGAHHKGWERRNPVAAPLDSLVVELHDYKSVVSGMHGPTSAGTRILEGLPNPRGFLVA
jgi:hypothetical protein